MNVRWLLNTSIIVGALLGTNHAKATCREQLTYSQAEGRNAWAEKWGYLMPGEATLLNANHQYVEFTTACYKLTTGVYCNPQLAVSALDAYVGGLVRSDTCIADCFAPTQPVLVEGKPQGIEDVVRAESRTLTALRLGSTPESPGYSEQSVSSFLMTEVETDILVFEGDSGEHLEVTSPHPVVLADGTLVEAKDVREGDELAGARGAPIRVIAVASYPFRGTVINVELESREKTENIIVAGGFLTGTSLFQKEWSHEDFRLLFRDHVDVDAILAEQ